MRKVRVVLTPILVLVALSAAAFWEPRVPMIAEFPFIWDVLMGAILGVALSLLPQMAGFAPRRNAQTGLLWVCGFLALLVVFYQYMTLVTGLRIDQLAFLSAPNTRVRMVEGAVLGYTSFTAGRGKI